MTKKQTTEQKSNVVLMKPVAPTTAPATKPAKPVKATKAKGAAKHQTSIALARELLGRKASEQEVAKAFTAHFAARGKSDSAWVSRRRDIYMKLAQRDSKAS